MSAYRPRGMLADPCDKGASDVAVNIADIHNKGRGEGCGQP